MANSLALSFLSGAGIMLIGYFWGDGILRALGATDATLELAREYGYIIVMMMPLALAQNTLGVIIRADGSPRYAMFTMAVGAVLNILLDPLAIFVLDWGSKERHGRPFSVNLSAFFWRRLIFSAAKPSG